MRKYGLSEFTEKLVTEMEKELHKVAPQYLLEKNVWKGQDTLRLRLRTVVSNGENNDGTDTEGIIEISPVVYLPVLYQDYISKLAEKCSIEEFARKLLSGMLSDESAFVYSTLADVFGKGNVEERCEVLLLPSDVANTEGYSYCRRWNDLVLVLAISAAESLVYLTDAFIKMFGVDVDRAYECALKSLNEEDFSILSTKDIYSATDEGAFDENIPQYVLTNELMFYGTRMVLREDVMARLYELCQGDFYLLPSSVHEWVICPKTVFDLREVVAVHREAQKALGPVKFLSSNVYIYRKEINAVSVVQTLNL